MFAGEKMRVSGLIWICFLEQIQGSNVPSASSQPSGVHPYENSYTPSSRPTSTVVLGPYRAIKAVTWSLPVAPIRPSSPDPDSLLQMPIMVPTAQLLSTIDEPSRGSQHTVNRPLGLHGLTSGSSSEAPHATTADDLTASHMI